MRPILLIMWTAFQRFILQDNNNNNNNNNNNSGTPREREARLSIQENLVMTSAYDLPSVQTLGEEEGNQKSEVSPSGEDYA